MNKPMKEKELREMATCLVCEQKIGASPIPLLWKVTAERHGVDRQAVSRQCGLTQLLGGSAELAMHMGADEDMTQVLGEASTFMVCDQCMLERLPEAFKQ